MLAVVPCLNEEQALPALLGRLREVAAAWTAGADPDRLEVLVVDDGSVDRTAEVARAHGARVARLSRNLGIGGAVQTGLKLAARQGYDCAVQIDGDGQHPPAELPRLLDAARGPAGADLVVGSRFLDPVDRDAWRSTWLRRLGIAWLALVLRVVTGLRSTDPTSGFRVYGRRALALFADNYPYDFPEPESLALARAMDLRVVEVAVRMQARQGGASSIRGLATAYYMVKVTLAVVLTYVRARAGRWRRARRGGPAHAITS